MTGKEMCKAIVLADFLRKSDGTAPTAEEIWNSSPSGELFQVFHWFEIAKLILSASNTWTPSEDDVKVTVHG